MMKVLLLIPSLLLLMPPVIADVEPKPGEVFKRHCMGDEKMDDNAYREQKSKYCDCIADFVYQKQTEKPLKEVIGICKEAYPPLN